MRKIFSFLLLMTTMLFVSGQMWAAGDVTGATSDNDAATKGAVCKNVTTSEYYSTIQGAIDDATEGNCIKLLSKAPNTIEGALLVNKVITLDFSGKTIKDYRAKEVIKVTANATLQYGYVETNDAVCLDALGSATQTPNCGVRIAGTQATLVGMGVWGPNIANGGPEVAVDVISGANVTIDGGTFYATSDGLRIQDATLTLKSTSFLSTTNVWAANPIHSLGGTTVLYIYDNAHFYGRSLAESGVWNVYGGSFESTNTNPLSNWGGRLYIYGGNYTSPEGICCINNYATFYVYGGTFSNNIGFNYGKMTAGYDYDDNQDGTYTVRQIVAKIVESDRNYFTVQDAIDDASANDEISLLQNSTENIVITTDITLNTNGKTLTGSVTADGATGIIKGSGMIDGELLIANAGALDIRQGTYVVDPTEFVPATTAYAVDATTIPGKYIVNHYLASIGEDKYVSFLAAMTEANKLTTTPTILLLDDAELNTAAIGVTKSMTIDLNGYTLAAVSSTNSYLNFATSKTVVTIQNGRIENSTAATTYPAQLVRQASTNTLTLQDVIIQNKGTYGVLVTNSTALNLTGTTAINGATHPVYASSGKIVLNNSINLGTLYLGNVISQVTNNEGASINILGLNGSGGIQVNTQNHTLANNGTMTIENGIFKGNITYSGTGELTLLAGTYNNTTKTALVDKVATGKTWVETETAGVASWTIYDAASSTVAIYNGKNYCDLRDAIKAVPANETEGVIKLIADIDIEIPTTNYFYVADKQHVTIDLNGHVLKATNNTNAGTMFYLDKATAILTIDDTSDDKDGRIVFDNKVSNVVAYTMGCYNGNFVINNGSVENISEAGTVRYAVNLSGSYSSLTVNGGRVYSKTMYAVRAQAGKYNENPTIVTLNGGEIIGYGGIWSQMTSGTATDKPNLQFVMNGGRLTSTDATQPAYYSYSSGANPQNVSVLVTNGVITGEFAIAGGYKGTDGMETVSIQGGTFISHNAFHSYKRGIELKAISGGAFYFDFEDNNTGSVSEFVEYVKPGHYAELMCRDDEDGAKTYTTCEGKYNPGKCDENHFWVVIDGEGAKEEKETTITGTWNVTIEGGVFEDEVPDTKTDVTIGDEEHQVIVTIEEGTNAETNRLVVNEGSAIIVKDGATLNVGLGGVVVGGDQSTTSITVEPGGKFVSNGTVVSSNEEDIVIMADNEKAGNFIIAPDVNFNYQPKAKVELYTQALQKDASTFKWQRFAMPLVSATYGGNVTNDHATANNGSPVVTYNNGGFFTGVDAWDYENDQWTYLESTTEMKPFLGYKLANTSTNGGVTYTFSGNLVGNVADDLSFVANGYNLFGNSYTAPINILSLIESVKENAPGVAGSIWLWNVNNQSYEAENFASIESEMSDYTEIPSLHTFILQLRDGSSASAEIDYTNAVWGHLLAGTNNAPKRAQAFEGNAMRIQLTSANGLADKITLMEKDSYSAEYEDGRDADKYMNADNVNLYTTLDGKDYSIVATDNLDGLNLSVQTVDETVYTLNFTKVAGNDYVLYDNVANQYMTITEGAAYSFVANANTTVEGRFQIVKGHKVTTDIDEVGSAQSTTGIYTVLGQYMGQSADFNSLPAGVYVINGQKVIK